MLMTTERTIPAALFIAGAWVEPTSGVRLDVRNQTRVTAQMIVDLTAQAQERTSRLVVSDVLRVLAGEPAIGRVS
jgi:hypothetical protein